MRAVDESWIRVVAQRPDVHATQDVEHAESGVAALVVGHGRTARALGRWRAHVVQVGQFRRNRTPHGHVLGPAQRRRRRGEERVDFCSDSQLFL